MPLGLTYRRNELVKPCVAHAPVLSVVTRLAQVVEIVRVVGNVPVLPILLCQFDDVVDLGTGLDTPVFEASFAQSMATLNDHLSSPLPLSRSVHLRKPGHRLTTDSYQCRTYYTTTQRRTWDSVAC